MLADRGAEISVLKRGLIPDHIPIHTYKHHKLAGIIAGSIKTLGIVNLTLPLTLIWISHCELWTVKKLTRVWT
jgi:hypothetical protein